MAAGACPAPDSARVLLLLSNLPEKELDRGLTHDFELRLRVRARAGPGGLTRRLPNTVPCPLSRALVSEPSRCHAGGDRPCKLPGQAPSVILRVWLKGWQSLSVRKREQSAADGFRLRPLTS